MFYVIKQLWLPPAPEKHKHRHKSCAALARASADQLPMPSPGSQPPTYLCLSVKRKCLAKYRYQSAYRYQATIYKVTFLTYSPGVMKKKHSSYSRSSSPLNFSPLPPIFMIMSTNQCTKLPWSLPTKVARTSLALHLTNYVHVHHAMSNWTASAKARHAPKIRPHW